MKGLFLCGANSTSVIWAKMLDEFRFQADTVDYPHEILLKAQSVSELTKWVYDNYFSQEYDFIVGHSMGGFITLELAKDYCCEFKRIILVETNLKPAKPFYRNLMTRDNLEKYGKEVIDMIKSETIFYQESLIQSIQKDFDYSSYIQNILQPVHIIYGNRGVDVYADRINDLCLNENTLKNIKFDFIEDSCHMPMIENPKQLVNIINQIIT